jgi:peptidoglycan-associated lipoprotein
MVKVSNIVISIAVIGALFLVGCASSYHMAKPTRMKSLGNVHFDTGEHRLDEEAFAVLDANVAWLEGHPDAVLVLEGHCDERGEASYNLQLGDLRARNVKAQLIASGIDPERLIMVVSHGELRPVDPRHTADAWRKNRRVEFIIR